MNVMWRRALTALRRRAPFVIHIQAGRVCFPAECPIQISHTFTYWGTSRKKKIGKSRLRPSGLNLAVEPPVEKYLHQAGRSDGEQRRMREQPENARIESNRGMSLPVLFIPIPVRITSPALPSSNMEAFSIQHLWSGFLRSKSFYMPVWGQLTYVLRSTYDGGRPRSG